ncbi:MULTISPECIES: hypothetical protein [unclassified Fusibacter]|uniref:hypothetical protein n=1 Tax=unclassified Fusibacter TaxID=2624464 RepID=UPI001012157D|nr:MULTISPECIES: hypothetical protein [unclassified Fusibacter]MCK8058460.1 hypothetical protein [Fusibacter sp. A2]NPE22772.1 hypothetical protein [Fusibacter sp. A1]RXV60329.1 hypothetical protein DWB64_13070 [Fusibacter sp. A1]
MKNKWVVPGLVVLIFAYVLMQMNTLSTRVQQLETQLRDESAITDNLKKDLEVFGSKLNYHDDYMAGFRLEHIKLNERYDNIEDEVAEVKAGFDRFESDQLYLDQLLTNDGRTESVFGYFEKADEDRIYIDYCEWLTHYDDQEKLTELGIEYDTLPSGFYILDEDETIVSYERYEYMESYRLVGAIGERVDPNLFLNELEEGTLVMLTLLDGKIITIMEQYRP